MIHNVNVAQRMYLYVYKLQLCTLQVYKKSGKVIYLILVVFRVNNIPPAKKL